MRKFIIKFWFGPYNSKLKILRSRAAVSNFILIAIAVLIKLFVSNLSIAIPLMILPLLIVYLTTFWYLTKYPVKWNDLDELQKHYYGHYWTTQVHKSQWSEDFKKYHIQWKELYQNYENIK